MKTHSIAACLLATLWVLAGTAASDSAERLISTEELEARLESVLPLDTRSPQDFNQGHIPGAAHVHFEAVSETRDGIPGMLRPAPELRQLLADSGVDPNRPIVIYSGMENAGDFRMAARLFFVLEYMGYSQVAILDGGYRKWVTEERPTASGALTVTAIPLEQVPEAENAAILMEKDDVLRALPQPRVLLTDQRLAAEYTGQHPHSNGHIPGAISQPMSDFMFGPQHLFKTGEALDAMLRKAADAVQIVTYCNTGHTSSVGYFAYRLAGFDNVAMYDASMREWSRDPVLPLERE